MVQIPFTMKITEAALPQENIPNTVLPLIKYPNKYFTTIPVPPTVSLSILTFSEIQMVIYPNSFILTFFSSQLCIQSIWELSAIIFYILTWHVLPHCIYGAIQKICSLKFGHFLTPLPLVRFSYRLNSKFYMVCLLLVRPPLPLLSKRTSKMVWIPTFNS